MKIFSKAAIIRPSLLKRHLESNQTKTKSPDQSYFERLGENVTGQRLDRKGHIYQKKVGIVKASYKASLLVAQNVKAFANAELVVLPAAKILVRNLVEEPMAKLDSLPFSNDTIKRHIQEMFDDSAEQATGGVEASKFRFAI